MLKCWFRVESADMMIVQCIVEWYQLYSSSNASSSNASSSSSSSSSVCKAIDRQITFGVDSLLLPPLTTVIH